MWQFEGEGVAKLRQVFTFNEANTMMKIKKESFLCLKQSILQMTKKTPAI